MKKRSIPHVMMINTLTSDPAVSMELGRRLAVNAKRQPRLHRRLGAALTRLFSAERSSADKVRQGRA